MENLIELLRNLNITKFEATSKHYGNTEKVALKVLYVDRFIHDHSAFNNLGYGVVIRK